MQLVARICVIGAILFSLYRTLGKTNDFQNLDFGAVYRGAAAVSAGETPYVLDEHGPLGSYIYGPALAFLAQPLAALDYLWACRIWMVFNWALALACLWMAIQLSLNAGRPDRNVWALFWLIAIPTASYIWSGIRVGQIAVLTGTLCLAWAFFRRRGWPLLGGVCLSAAATLKLAPAFLIPYLIVRREWRGLAGVGVGAATLAFLPVIWVGPSGAVQLHREWAAHCRNTQVVEQTFRPENQSLIGQLARLPAISNGHHLANAQALDELGRAYGGMILFIGLGVYGFIERSRRNRSCPPNPDWDNWNIALLMVTTTLLSPRAWTCNFISLVLVNALLARTVIGRKPGWRLAVSSLVLSIVVCAAPKVGARANWTLWNWFAQGKDFWSALIALIVCGRCFVLSQHRESTPTPKIALAA